MVLLPLLDPAADNELPLDNKEALSEKPESLSGLSVRTPKQKYKLLIKVGSIQKSNPRISKTFRNCRITLSPSAS